MNRRNLLKLLTGAPAAAAMMPTSGSAKTPAILRTNAPSGLSPSQNPRFIERCHIKILPIFRDKFRISVQHLIEAKITQKPVALYHLGGDCPSKLRLVTVASVFTTNKSLRTLRGMMPCDPEREWARQIPLNCHTSVYCHLRREHRIFCADEIYFYDRVPPEMDDPHEPFRPGREYFNTIRPLTQSHDPLISKLIEAAVSQEPIAFHYSGGSTPRGHRMVTVDCVFPDPATPNALGQPPHLYVSAYCHLRQAHRTFRTDKIGLIS